VGECCGRKELRRKSKMAKSLWDFWPSYYFWPSYSWQNFESLLSADGLEESPRPLSPRKSEVRGQPPIVVSLDLGGWFGGIWKDAMQVIGVSNRQVGEMGGWARGVG